MSQRRLFAKVWRYRVAGLMVILGSTSLLILVGSHLLQHSSNHNLHNDWREMPLKERKEFAGAAEQRQDNRYKNYKGKRAKHILHANAKRDYNLYSMPRTKTNIPPVVFLKTHKTGSSTVQNLLFRMGERNNATFAFPSYTYQFSYPDKFKTDFVEELPKGSSHFDIICSHMRLDLEELKHLMPQTSIYVSILRDPVQTFESVFSYYTYYVPAFSLAKKASETKEHRSALSVFVESPELFWDPKDPDNGLGKNPMSFDFGLDIQNLNSSWSAHLTLLKETFHLVMLAEHFDESLVLLGAMLKLELEELAYVRFNTRSAHNITPLDDMTKDRIRAWNNLDVQLYDFFLQLFWEKATEYGLEKLKRDVDLLRASTDRITQKCVVRKEVPPVELEDFIKPWQTDSVTILGYHIQPNLSEQEQEFCVRLVLPELQYHAHLYFKQYDRAMRPAPTE